MSVRFLIEAESVAAYEAAVVAVACCCCYWNCSIDTAPGIEKRTRLKRRPIDLKKRDREDFGDFDLLASGGSGSGDRAVGSRDRLFSKARYRNEWFAFETTLATEVLAFEEPVVKVLALWLWREFDRSDRRL